TDLKPKLREKTHSELESEIEGATGEEGERDLGKAAIQRRRYLRRTPPVTVRKKGVQR
ncbi:hypothetical protein U1Q18_032730, partial [Sarracenia purpurea var. burkii]